MNKYTYNPNAALESWIENLNKEQTNEARLDFCPHLHGTTNQSERIFGCGCPNEKKNGIMTTLFTCDKYGLCVPRYKATHTENKIKICHTCKDNPKNQPAGSVTAKLEPGVRDAQHYSATSDLKGPEGSRLFNKERTKMRIEAVLFDGSKEYDEMALALKRSVEANSPNTPIRIRRVKTKDKEILDQKGGFREVIMDNARKTKHHLKVMKDAKNGELIGMFDVDLIVLNDLSSIEEMDFDLAYTIRRSDNYLPINSGVVFVRKSKKTMQFYQDWHDNVMFMLEHPETYSVWTKKYGGINQCGLGMMLEESHTLKTLKLPCREWNMTSDLYMGFASSTKIVHVQSGLRKSLIYRFPISNASIRRICTFCRPYFKEQK